jgi:dihydrofolate reductase
MRRITMLNRISLDGYYAGPNGEIDWFIHDPAVDAAAHEMMQPDTVLFGRLTYQMFEAYWPMVAQEPSATPQARQLAVELNELTKIVFSRTLEHVSWTNSVLIREDPVDFMPDFRRQDGPDIAIFGSGSIVQQLTNAGLIDDYLFVVSPILLGTGRPLFHNTTRTRLECVQSRRFESGNVLLHYRRREP